MTGVGADRLDAVRRALAIGPGSSAWERTVDITTTGARTGRPRRIETWSRRGRGVDGRESAGRTTRDCRGEPAGTN